MKKVTPLKKNPVKAKIGNQPGGPQKKPTMPELVYDQSYQNTPNNSGNTTSSYPDYTNNSNVEYPYYDSLPNDSAQNPQKSYTISSINPNYPPQYANTNPHQPLHTPPSMPNYNPNYNHSNPGADATVISPPPFINSNTNSGFIPHPPPILTAPPPITGPSLTLPSYLLNPPPQVKIEAPPIVNSPKPDFSIELCVYCKQIGVQLILPNCYHLCHLHCYVEDNKCPECKGEERVVEIPYVVDMEKCAICRVTSNLLNCFECGKKYCFICVSNKIQEGCCGDIKNSLDKYKRSCPGCLYTIGYDNFVPIRCKEHDTLCKKCWNLGVAVGKCVMGCELECSMAYYCHCDACDENEIKYFGDFVCPNNCEICDFCQSIQILKCLKRKQDISCPSCEFIED